ncbi:MAG: sialidase family protein [Planctomycetota bacterium]|nr:sialidase family protein [Planctomycetota bacterium]
MTRTIKGLLLVLATLALLAPSALLASEELWVIKGGVLDKAALTPTATEVASDHIGCGGRTVDGLYICTPEVMDRPNWARFTTAKSAVGDCVFQVVFACAVARPQWRFPNITITDRARLYFWKPGSPILLSNKKMSLPLENFQSDVDNGPFDGNLHTMAVKRVGDKLSCYYDEKKLNEQTIDPHVRLHLWFDALHTHIKIKSIKLTAEKLSDNLTTAFASAAPIAEIYRGSGIREKPTYGKACRYRIPALAISKERTILAFAEARRTNGADIGDIDTVVRRSEDNGETWGPEIVVWDDGARSVNNPSAVVDPTTGRIWLYMGRWIGTTPSQHAAYSDDDGRTWSTPKNMTEILRTQINDERQLVIPGPGSGIALTRGPHAGRLIIPMNHGAQWGPSVVYSDDSGETWKPGGALHANIGESKCAELSDGSVLFVGNPGAPETRRRLTIITKGGTQNATEMWHAEDLKHAGCQGAVARHSFPHNGKPGLLLYSGPGVEGARAQGTLRGSYDEGKTWPWTLRYYEGGSGYCDIAVLSDGRVAVLFEKDGKSNLGFTILPVPPPWPPAT